MIPTFLGVWAVAAVCVMLGYYYQKAVICHYVLWIIFVNFTPMQRDFDGGFDAFMIGAGFFLLFLPADQAFSLDNLRRKLSQPFASLDRSAPARVTILAYYIPVAICLGFLYFDSVIHKLFAPHWRAGLGTWLPATQPYYISAWDTSFLLNQQWLQQGLSYSILIFQFTFIFLFWQRYARVIYLVMGIGLHLGITVSLNIYPFGLGMLCFYCLMVPFAWWRRLGERCVAKQPTLTVFFDKACPLCRRAVLVMQHFDVLKRIEFKNAQDHAENYAQMANIPLAVLLTDLYGLDAQGRIYSGVQTYIRIFKHSGYLAFIGGILSLPLISTLAEKKYRAIADNRVRCDDVCVVPQGSMVKPTWYTLIIEQYAQQKPRTFAVRLSKVLMMFLMLQLNSTLHYGILYRLKLPQVESTPLAQASNALLLWSQTFVGIVPHALYLHDHFEGYDHVLALTYTDAQGEERWLPFVDSQGRLVSPNWGRVHSMWANIAVTPHIDPDRLRKFIMKVTAFYGHQLGLDLNQTTFHLQMKKNSAPSYWVYDLRHQNAAQPWVVIGTMTWKNKAIQVAFPPDINAL
jgi:predicted DCC family thiol-disulfide oxidoreductase YuxK